jgi:hypothetical protein
VSDAYTRGATLTVAPPASGEREDDRMGVFGTGERE